MKKFLFLLTAGFLAVSGSWSQVQVRLPVEVSWPVSGPTAFQETSFLGFAPEIIVDKIGWGFDGAARFNRVSGSSSWTLDFQGNLFVSYHPEGPKGALDPFLLAGLGSAGTVDLTNGVRQTGGPVLAGIAESLEPVLGAGLGWNLGGIVVGGRVLWYPFTWDIPCAPIAGYGSVPVQAGVFVAAAFGD